MYVPLPAKFVPINGRRTSIRIEPELWLALRRAATEQGRTAKAFIEHVSRSKRPDRPLASELRVAICEHFVELTATVADEFMETMAGKAYLQDVQRCCNEPRVSDRTVDRITSEPDPAPGYKLTSSFPCLHIARYACTYPA